VQLLIAKYYSSDSFALAWRITYESLLKDLGDALNAGDGAKFFSRCAVRAAKRLALIVRDRAIPLLSFPRVRDLLFLHNPPQTVSSFRSRAELSSILSPAKWPGRTRPSGRYPRHAKFFNFLPT
jgi:hypothetical protein